MEQENRRECGQGAPNAKYSFLMESCPSSLSSMAAQVLAPSLSVAKLEQGSHFTHGVAWMIAARELLAPISCMLLVMHHQMFQQCCPIVQTPDQPRKLAATGSSVSFSQPASQGDPWPAADPCQGQDSQLSALSIQGCGSSGIIY